MGFKVVVVGLMTMPACGDSSGGTVSDSNGASQSGTDSATEPTGGDTEPTSGGSKGGSTSGDEGGMSDSLSGTVSSGFESESMSGSGSSATATETMGMTSGSEGAETGEVNTGDPVDCATFLDEASCEAAGCMAIIGRRFVSDEAMFCLDPPSFLACVEQALCAEVITTACKGQVKYQIPNACIPGDFVPCAPPADPDMDGYLDCQ